ncbi:MAG: sugar ABC transporter permease, partial [Oscillospiraceae bacterium]|nr:sugar ABC transporter permease [Oscillospiraceae bacterium]
LALLLNDEFPGRLFFRTVLFLPVIFMSDRFVTIFNTMLGANGGMGETSNSFLTVSDEMTGFVAEIINSFGFLSEYIQKFTVYATKFFDLVWGMGIQTIIFIIGLKSIPAYLYEVADMEGATKWETFWKITFPLLTPSILLAFVFTVVDHFNSYNNTIIVSIKEMMLTRIDYAVTQSWLYAILVFVMVGIGSAVISRKIVRLD